MWLRCWRHSHRSHLIFSHSGLLFYPSISLFIFDHLFLIYPHILYLIFVHSTDRLSSRQFHPESCFSMFNFLVAGYPVVPHMCLPNSTALTHLVHHNSTLDWYGRILPYFIYHTFLSTAIHRHTWHINSFIPQPVHGKCLISLFYVRRLFQKNLNTHVHTLILSRLSARRATPPPFSYSLISFLVYSTIKIMTWFPISLRLPILSWYIFYGLILMLCTPIPIPWPRPELTPNKSRSSYFLLWGSHLHGPYDSHFWTQYHTYMHTLHELILFFYA